MGGMRKRVSGAAGLVVACALLAVPAAAPAQTFSAFGSAGTGNGQFDDPLGVAVDQKGQVYVADGGNHRIQKFTNTGGFLTSYGTQGSGNGQMEQPTGVAVDTPAHKDDDPNIYFADRGNKHVQKLDPKGSFLLDFGVFADPAAVDVDPTGHVYVTDVGDEIVVKFAPNGTLLDVYGKPGGGPGSGPGQFDDPLDVGTDADGASLVADSANNRVQKLNPLGSPVWQASGLANPTGVDHDIELEGVSDLVDRVWVTERLANQFVKLDDGGNVLDTFTGSGPPGPFNAPYGMAVDCADNVFVSDSGNNRVQRFGTVAEPPCSAPDNTTSPELAGLAQPGSGLALQPGIWTGSPAPRFSYRWQHCQSASADSCADIAGETGLTYVVTDADRGLRLRAVVVAANNQGIVSEPTDMTPPVPTVPVDPLPPAPPNPPPVPPVPPTPPPQKPTAERAGKAGFKVTCPVTGAIDCQVRANVVGPGRSAGVSSSAARRGFVTLARVRGSVGFKQTRKFKLRLSKRGRRLVRAGYNERAVMRVFVDGKRRLTDRVRVNRRTAKRFRR